MTNTSRFISIIFLLLSPAAHAGFVIEGSGTGTAGETLDVQAEFDFVTHNFGLGGEDSIQITLTNLSEITSYRGNLLTSFFWSLGDNPDTGNPVGDLSTTDRKSVV